MNCQGYKKESCWIPRLPASIYCATCESAMARDVLRELTAGIASCLRSDVPPDIVDRVMDPPILKALTASNRDGTLDQLLYALYRKDKRTLRAFVERFRRSPSDSTLLLRIRNHRTTPLCPVYGWMLREGLFPDMFFPWSCLRCLAHAIRSSPAPKAELRRSILWASSNLNSPLPTTIRHSLTLPDGVQRIVEVGQALADSDDYQFRNLLASFYTTCKGLAPPAVQSQLTAAWTQEFSPEAPKRREKERMMSVLEELMAKAWHPSRFQHWCWEEDEKKDMVDLPAAEPLEARNAAWNFRWDLR